MARRLRFEYSPASDEEDELVDEVDSQDGLEEEDAEADSYPDEDLQDSDSSEDSQEYDAYHHHEPLHTVNIEYGNHHSDFELVVRVDTHSQASDPAEDSASDQENWHDQHEEESNEEIEADHPAEEEMQEDGEEDEEEVYGEEESQAVEPPQLQVIVDNRATFSMDDYEAHFRHKIGQPYPVLTARNKHLFEECSICFCQLFKKHSASCYLECVHWYHFSCLKSWSENKKECPVCRKEFLNILTVSE